MNSRFIRVLLGLGLLFWVIDSQAQDSIERPELANWQFSENINLSDEMPQDSRLDAMFVEEFLLISHPNLDSGDNCGSVLVLGEDQGGQYRQVQTLSAEDFGISCEAADGFGFSVDFADGLLVIGAPEQVFIEPGEFLQRGSVYIYQMDNAGSNSGPTPMTAQARVVGTFAPGNVAWGTRVKTDGRRILVQGNAAGNGHLAHGRAVSRTVNLLERDSSGTWRIIQQFTNNESLYGHDFVINEQMIIINSHAFEGFNEGLFVAPTNFYSTTLEIYNLSGVSAELRQSIPLGTDTLRQTNGDDRLQDLDQLFWQGDELVVFTTRFGIAITGEIIWFEPDQNNLFEQISMTSSFRVNRFNIQVGEELVFGRGGFGLSGTINSYVPNQEIAQRVQQALIPGRNNQGIFSGRLFDELESFRLNTANNRLVLVGEQQDVQQLSIFRAVTALDPVITGTWWFGPQLNGQGLTLEVLLGNRLLLHWFTYDLAGRQMWVRGVGTLENGTVQMQLTRARGPRFPVGEFDPADRVVEQWGTAEISFSDCRNGQLTYQSVEFGSDTLPMMALTDNNLQCNRGFLIDNQGKTPNNSGANMIVGSLFDRSRSGEGFIFMPLSIDSSSIDNTNIKVEGFWLTYNQQGDQAWYYLGQLQRICENPNISFTCEFVTLTQPRMPEGAIFGPAYNPADRVISPWGTFGPVKRIRGSRLRSVSFDNPDGAGTLMLDRLTRPIGY